MPRFNQVIVCLLFGQPRSLKFRLCVIAFCLVAVFGLANGVSHSRIWKTDGEVKASKLSPRAGLRESITVRAANNKPAVFNLSDGHEVETNYRGPAEFVRMLNQKEARPLALASADFDEDGNPDLVSGYATPNGGIATLHRGNMDAISPNSAEAQNRRASGEFSDAPFLNDVQVFALNQPADFLGTGDFNADGHQDIVIATRGSNRLYFMLGDGHGNFPTSKGMQLAGGVTAFAAGEINRADGMTDIVVAVRVENGAQVQVFEGPTGAINAKPEIFDFPSVAAIALGRFHDHQEIDLAVASGSELIIISGRDRKLSLDPSEQSKVLPSMIERQTMPYQIASLASGDFIWDKAHQTDLGLLSADGSVHFLSRGVGTVAKTASGKSAMAWSEQRRVSRPAASSSISVPGQATDSSGILIAGKFSAHQTDDVVLLNGQQQQINLINSDPAARDEEGNLVRADDLTQAVTTSLSAGSVAAVLPMRLNQQAISGLVLLQSGQNAPTVIPSAPSAIITVNSNADTNVRDSVITLREAILIANGDPSLPVASLTTAEKAQISGTPAPGLDQINFNIPASQGSSNPLTGESKSSTATSTRNNGIKTSAGLSGPRAPQRAGGDLASLFPCNTPSYPVTNFFSGINETISLVAEDFNSDGRADIAAFNNPGGGSNSATLVSILLSLGANGLGSPTPLIAPSNGGQMLGGVSADFDGDGRPDLLIPRITNNSFIFFGAGDGTFTLGPDIPISSPRRSAVVGDFDGDGHPDIAFATDAGISVVLNKGNRTFGAPTDFALLLAPTRIGVGDFNGDGKSDLVLVNGANNSISILLGTGTGSFGAPTNFSVGSSPNSIAVRDFNNDGKMDVAVVNGGDGTVTVVRGNGTGGFGLAFTFNVGGSPNSIATGDFNNDGKMDIAVANGNANSRSISVLRGTGTGSFSAAVNYPVGDHPSSVVAKDIDGDGQLDLAVVNTPPPGVSPGTITVLKGDGAGNFSRTSNFTAGVNPLGVAVSDFNGDGKPDVAVANFMANTGTVSILLGNGAGSLGTATSFPLSGGNRGISVVVGDLNKDGKQDLVVTAIDNNNGGNLSILLGDGIGGFGAATRISGVGNFSGPVAIFDFNNDGKLDLAVPNGNNIAILLGVGNGTFGAPTNFPVNSAPEAIAIGDFDGDQKMDLVVSYGGNVSILLGNGNGTFGAAVDIPTGISPISIAVGDFDGDGAIDLALTGSVNQGKVAVMYGSGQGTFSTPTLYPMGGTNGQITTFDFNGDGQLDLVVTNPSTNGVSVLLNTGGTFTVLPGFHTGNGPNGIGFADFNGDGKPDLVVANQSSGDVSLVFNTCAVAPDLSLSKSHIGNFNVGTNGTYNFVVNNHGAGATSAAINIIDTLPSGLFFVSGSGTGWSCSAVGSTVTCTNPGPLAPGASSNVSITVGVAAQAVPSVTNTAKVSTAVETNTTDNTASDPTIVILPCVLTPLTVGQTVNGALANSDCRSPIRGANDTLADHYSFTGSTGQPVAITLTSTDFDTFLYLLGPDGQVLVADDDGAGNGNSRIPSGSGFLTLPVNGVYTIEATSFGPGRTGNYAVSLTTGTNTCNFTISPTSQPFGSNGGEGTVGVTSPSGCNWAANSNASFITINSGSSGSGNGSVGFTVAPNVGATSRTGTLTVAGQTFTITQAAGTTCSFSILPTSQSFSSASGTGSFTITTSNGCTHTATSNAGFIHVTSGATGSANGTVGFSVDTNVGSTPRVGTISVTISGSTQTFTVSQSGNTANTRTITLLSPLPKIIDTVTIDGTTQPGYSGAPLIEINGANLRNSGGGNGLVITAGNSTVRGLILNRFNSSSRDAAILLITNGGNIVENCYIGTDVSGTITADTPFGTGAISTGIAIRSSNTNRIGGTTAAQRNIISGIDGTGILISGGATANSIQGNYVGADVTGNISLGLQRNGVVILEAPSNTIGGAVVGSGNLISGNIDYGVFIQNVSSNNLVQGNLIGVNAAGTAKLPNGNAGVFISNPTNPQGLASNSGTTVPTDQAANNSIGGNSASAANVVSGNDAYGIIISSGVSGTQVQGNLIGTNSAGTAAISNSYGVSITQATSTTVGGAVANVRNVISGNLIQGVSLGQLSDGQTGGTGATVQGNLIGTDAAGTGNLGNGGDGVFVNVNSQSHTINSNTIAFNGGNGILIPNTSPDGANSAVQIDLQNNLLVSNAKLGVDLGGDANTDGDGPTANTPGVHTGGANLLQNKPELQSAGGPVFVPGADKSGITVTALGVTVSGTYPGAPNQSFNLQFYFGSNCQNAGTPPNQSGQFVGVIPIRLGTKQVTTNAQGTVSYSFLFPIPGSATSGFVNAQATSLVGNSSEMSACQAVTTTSLDPPTISSITPSGGVGSQVTINGTNLQGATVTFTGTATLAQIVSNSGTQLVVIVPSGATTGPITVTTAGGTATSSTFNIKPTPTITWANPADIIVGTALSSVQLNATFTSGGQPVPGTAVYSPLAGTILNAGLNQTLSVTFTPADPNSFGSVSGTVHINVLKTSQTITFGGLANKTFGDAPFTVSATATSGLPVSFNVASGPATINANTVTLSGAGTVTIQANQAGDATFNPAPAVQQSFTVAKGQASISLSNFVQIFDGTPKSVTATTTPAGLSGLVVTYNGSTTPPTAVGSYSVLASLNNPNYQASNFLGTLRIIELSSNDSKNVNPGSQNTASANPNGNNAGVTANLNHTNGGTTATVTVGVYSANPIERGLVNAGGGFVDVKVSSPNADDTVVVNYYYPSSVTGANETALQLYYFKGFSWLPVRGSGNSTPLKNTTDNLDGTASGGKFTVTLDNTSSPKVSELTGTVFAATTAIMGDINGDNLVNVGDLLLIANKLAGNVTFTPVQAAAADVQQDGTGKITLGDLITLANFLAGNTKSLPVGGP